MGLTPADKVVCVLNRWLKQEYQLQFAPEKQPPIHMPIAYGLVDLTKMAKPSEPLPQPVHPGEGEGSQLRVGAGSFSDGYSGVCQFCADRSNSVSGRWWCMRGGEG